MKKLILLCVFALSAGFFTELYARFPFWPHKKTELKAVVASPQTVSAKTGPKPYVQVIAKGAKTMTGFLKVHKVEDKYYFEIPDSLFGRDMLVVSRIANSAAESRKGFLGFAGDKINENEIRFDWGPKNKVFLKSISYAERASDSTGMFFAVQRSNIQPIVAAFDVKAFNKDSVRKTLNPVIEITDFVNNDNNVLFFDESMKKYLALGALQTDRSYIDTIKAFSRNIEIRTVKTYLPKPQSASDLSGTPLTYELNSSIVLLPEKLMQSRCFDPRVGYFTTSYTDFDKNPQGVEAVRLITRWRLEPQPWDVERYKRGELVEPQKPIVFYIDPATPRKWVPYLIAGVNDWQKAFEKAGFKKAIYALEAPKDSSWSLEDATHSAIVYKPSDLSNASGPHVHDPRTGEILETHVNWYHNVMKLLHDWYFVQASAVDSAARHVQFNDSLMGELIRFVSSHEVGHTLGLRHNFGASSTIPVAKLRDKEWVEVNGHTPSIMDYARFNYVAQPEDSIGRAGIFPRIGMYDEWAIEWGYRWFPEFKDPQEESAYLNRWVVEKLRSDNRYSFGTESDMNDPHNQSEDLGDDAMLASEYGIRNLKRIVPNLLKWCYEPNKDYTKPRDMYMQVVAQYTRYLGHVVKNVAGIYSTPKTVEQGGSVYTYVPASIQRQAVEFLGKQLMITPTWLIDKELIEKVGVDPVTVIGNVQKLVISRLLNQFTFDKMWECEAYYGKEAYLPSQLLTDLNAQIMNDLGVGQFDIYRRNLQNTYLSALIGMIRDENMAATDAGAIVRLYLEELKVKLSTVSGIGMAKAHLLGMRARIEQALNPRK